MKYLSMFVIVVLSASMNACSPGQMFWTYAYRNIYGYTDPNTYFHCHADKYPHSYANSCPG